MEKTEELRILKDMVKVMEENQFRFEIRDKSTDDLKAMITTAEKTLVI